MIDKNYNQYEGENVEDWKYRIIFSKVKKECKLSWNEICDLLCLTCSGEYLRKIAYGVMRYDSYIKEKASQSLSASRAQTQINELESKEFSMEREKMRMQDQKRELRKLLREWARAEHIEKEIKDAVKEAIVKNPIIQKKSPKIGHDNNEHREAALLLSDWHSGMTTTNATNIYNDATFYSRIQELIKKTIEYGRANNISCLHVFALGDLINGLIHVTTRINNTENVIQQTMQVAEVVCRILNTLSEEFSQIKVYFARGNHDRVTPNKKESIAGESFFDVIPWFVKARLEGFENVEIVENELDEEIIVAKIMGHTVFAVHGHKDKVNNVVQNLTLMLHEFPEYIFMGHYHSAAEREIQGAEVIVNGSLCGTDDYAFSLRRTSKACQKLIIFNEDGRLCTYNIKLDVK